MWYRNCIKVSLGPGSSTPRSHKMFTKVICRLLVFVLVFTMFATHQVWGEKDCYDERDSVKIECKNTLKLGTEYVLPSDSCSGAAPGVCPCMPRHTQDLGENVNIYS